MVFMNTVNIFRVPAAGWGLLFVGQLAGSYYGAVQAKEGNAEIERQAVGLQKNMHQNLERMAQERVAAGKPLGIFQAGAFKRNSRKTCDKFC
jgi:hypothetical protein